MTPHCPLHEFLAERYIDDDVYGRAYGEVGDFRRSLMKTAAARLYSWYPPDSAPTGVRVGYAAQGFVSSQRTEPMDYALIFLDAESRSPSRMLAGVLPAVTAGVERVVPVWTCPAEDIHPPMLTALEIIGVEEAACLGESEVIPAAGAGSGVVLDFREGTGWEREVCEEVLPEWVPPAIEAAGVFMGTDASFDLEALAFAHPDLSFEVWGANGNLPEGEFVARSGSAEEFAAVGYDVAYCPGRFAGALSATLVFGPGHESCWVWPDLHREFFMRNTIYWGPDAPWTEMM